MTSCLVRVRGERRLDASALSTLLDRRNSHLASAVTFCTDPDAEDLVTHAYVAVESVVLVWWRLVVAAVVALVDDLLSHLIHDFAKWRVARTGDARSLAGCMTCVASLSGDDRLAMGRVSRGLASSYAAARWTDTVLTRSVEPLAIRGGAMRVLHALTRPNLNANGPVASVLRNWTPLCWSPAAAGRNRYPFAPCRRPIALVAAGLGGKQPFGQRRARPQ